jgi:hypothetical protein
MPAPLIAEVDFTDGPWRPVYENPDSRQYVLDDQDEPVYALTTRTESFWGLEPSNGG